jgi:TPR repeat protein
MSATNGFNAIPEVLQLALETKVSLASKADLLYRRAHAQWDQGNLRSAFCLFLLAAKKGDSGAQHCLGYFYDNGIGIKPNRMAALYWYRRSYRHGERIAASNIGIMFRDEKRTKQALEWFHRAITLGDADANLEVAKILFQQKGNESKAIPYLIQAIKASRFDITPAGKEEARGLLKKLQKRIGVSERP